MKAMGIDLGDARTGVAFSQGQMAEGSRLIEGSGLRRIAREAADLARERDVELVVIGDPLNMDGSTGERSEKAHAFGKLLEGQLFARGMEGVRICYQDERLSSVEAHEILSATGNTRRGHREKVDMLAAELILERFLKEEQRRAGNAAAEGKRE